ncbi:protein trichome birefringence-like 38 [Lathyrus oleraceus]|uniref:Trichome birefringence-like N-terminal domain-containing protein n=1 Tax=Pisum sativum TaxID=3888 RepID=A0A9D4ZV52_PEA|nr:protein trichome birefringence-like 38 [Pisum sativum]KAI5386797.1 hypothetical protein KIW84_073080 [Pisum sativum]
MGSNVYNLIFLSMFSLALLVSMHQVRAKESFGRGRKHLNSCNLFSGSWVIDNSSKPLLYNSSTCPFLESQFDCEKYGRKDTQYLKYSWNPNSCSLPRFNGEDFLNKWKGKKIMFVGDSLSLNMWESLSCMIHASVPNAATSFSKKDPISTVIFKDYGVTIHLYRTPYLVDIIKENVGQVLTLNSIKAGDAWIGMDMLIFNSWHWWIHTGKSQSWDYIRDGSNLVKNMDRLEAFYKGLTTWAHWVEANVDPSKTKLFFQGISPTHYQGKDWNEPNNTCNGEDEPVLGPKYPTPLPPPTDVVNKVLKNMKKQVSLLDITLLSQLRKDAHPSVYTENHRSDCSHWCLPGLPDTWNILLNAALTK